MIAREETSTGGFMARIRATRRRIRSTRAGKIALQVLVSVLGVAVIVVGVALLALPGPGWLIIFAGLGILASEFEWASRLLQYARAKVSGWTGWVAGRSRPVQVLIGAVGLVVLGGLFVAAWLFYLR